MKHEVFEAFRNFLQQTLTTVLWQRENYNEILQ
jgi:hypothetical protein